MFGIFRCQGVYFRTSSCQMTCIRYGYAEKCMNSAFCKLCQKSIDLSAMGKSALDSHAKGKKHKDRMSTLCSEGHSRMQQFICAPMGSINSASTPDLDSRTMIWLTSPNTVSVSTHINKSDTLKAEVWWFLKTCFLTTHFHQMKKQHMCFNKCLKILQLPRTWVVARPNQCIYLVLELHHIFNPYWKTKSKISHLWWLLMSLWIHTYKKAVGYIVEILGAWSCWKLILYLRFSRSCCSHWSCQEFWSKCWK